MPMDGSLMRKVTSNESEVFTRNAERFVRQEGGSPDPVVCQCHVTQEVTCN